MGDIEDAQIRLVSRVAGCDAVLGGWLFREQREQGAGARPRGSIRRALYDGVLLPHPRRLLPEARVHDGGGVLAKRRTLSGGRHCALPSLRLAPPGLCTAGKSPVARSAIRSAKRPRMGPNSWQFFPPESPKRAS